MDGISDQMLEQLNDKDKLELRQILMNEQQKARVQSHVHSLTEICFKKCVTSTIKSGNLDKNEDSCMTNCTQRFLDISSLSVQHLTNMRMKP
ncbi:Tim10/DDP family zinc finger protein [Xylariomycetidae sp. FL0641]|nr:Tim10/DDP family zinc finger protein [Xylariomycetidae sp. FL0641]